MPVMLRLELKAPGTAVIGAGAAHNRGAAARLQALQEGHQRRLHGSAAPCLRERRDIEAGQSLRLHLHVDLGIDMRCVQRHVPQPRSDCVDVDARAEQMNRGRVADRMRADTLLYQ